MSAVPAASGRGAQPTRHSSSLLACVRESSPPSDPEPTSPSNDNPRNGSSAEPKKRRFHPLRGLRRMFRRAPRVPEAAAASAVDETCNHADHLAVPEVQMRSRSASELVDANRQNGKRNGTTHSGSSNGGSTGVLSGALSLSHDSIFTSDSRAGSSSPRGGSAVDIPESLGRHHNGAISPTIGALPNVVSHAGVRAELFEAVRRRRGRSRSEDEEEDLGLPSSPYGVSPSTTADEHNNLGAHSTCSDGSLLSMGSNDMDEDFAPSANSSQLLFGEKPHSDVTDMESDGGDRVYPLSHIAAKHKIAIRPKRTHGPPRLRRLNTTPNVLPSTPEAIEEVSLSPAVHTPQDAEACLPSATAVAETNSPAVAAELVEPPTSPVSPSPASSSFEAILERQLKSASLPPGLAPPFSATSPSDDAPEVKLSRSLSSSEQPSQAQIKPAYRRAVSAVRIEQAALASAAVSKFSAMFGDEKPQEKPVPMPRSSPAKRPDELLPSPAKKTEELVSPAKRPTELLKPEELASPVREIKSILKKEPESPTRKDAPRLAPKPEPRRISMASTRQRVEPVLKDTPLPPTPTTPTSNFILVSYTDDSLELYKGFESPSSLDSLEDVRSRVRSPSHSQMDSLERNLKMSSDSLSSGTELSSTSDEVRPTPKLRQSWQSSPSPDVKLRSVKSRHSDPPAALAPPPELLIRKSSSVDSILSDNNNSSSRKTSSDDSLSSGEEVNLRPSEIRRRLKDNEWPVRTDKAPKPSTPEFLRLQLSPVEAPAAKTEELDNRPKVNKSSPQRARLYSNPASIEIKDLENDNYTQPEPTKLSKSPERLPKSPEIVARLPKSPEIVARLVKTEEPKEREKEVEEIKPVKAEVEEPTSMQILPNKLKMAEAKPEVVLRRKSVLPDPKTEECELFKVFARRSLKLSKDSDNNWEAVGLVKSRDSDKENDEELKDKNLINNNVSVTNSLNRRPQTAVFIKPEQQKDNNKAARPISFSDKFKWSMKEKEIELVKTESPAAPSGTASLPPAVNSDMATIKTLTPKVRKKLDQWERWAQHGGSPQP